MKPSFEIKDIPNAVLGIFGVRTEAEVASTTLKKSGRFEIREIAPHLELSVLKTGNRASSGNRSFDALFAFIRGANRASKAYAMTAPVWQEEVDGTWKTSFYLEDEPSRVPSPTDPTLSIEEKPKLRFAVIRFAGSVTDRKFKDAERRLRQWIAEAGLKAVGLTRLAQYDPPFAIPFFRRNEVQIPIT